MNENKIEVDQYYNGLSEKKYPSNHPAVSNWVIFFRKRFGQRKIFETFTADMTRSASTSQVVASSWHQFSEFMPWLLCQACASLSTNEKRHFAIQTAFEELGMRDADKIHHEMFWDAVNTANPSVDKTHYAVIQGDLDFLKLKLVSAKSDSYILGLLMGLEGPAEENIDLIFQSISFNEDSERALAQHEFFVVHRQIEIEHVKLTVANFLRFCSLEEEKQSFIAGFDDGILFWEKFWGNVKELIKQRMAAA